MNSKADTNAHSLGEANKMTVTNHRHGEQYRQRILLTIAWVGSIVSFVYASLLWFVYSNALSALSDSIYAIMYLLTLIFIKQRKLSFSAYWIVFWAGIQVSSGSALFVGPDTGFTLYFLTLPLLIYFLLDQEPFWARLATMLYGCVLFVIGHTVYIPDYQADISTSLSNFIFVTNALVVFAVIFLTVRFFAQEIKTAYREQEKLVLQDSLTGLPNQRYVEQHSQQLLALCDRYGHPFSLARITLDISDERYSSAEQINRTTFEAASYLKQNSREADIVARVERNEFVILMPETDMEGATEIKERLKRLSSDKGSVVTAQIGLSYCDSHSMKDINELIQNTEPNDSFTITVSK